MTRDQTETSLKPTRFNVLRALSNALKAVPPDGLLVLAFSGHGTERNGRAFLLPADAQVNADIELLEASALEVAALKNMIRNRRSSPASPVTGVAQVVVLLDACRNDPTSGKDTSINPLTPAYDFSLRNSNVKAFVTLYATSLGARAYENRARKQGYFIGEVVAALRGAASDALNERGEVTLDRLIRHVEDEVPARVALETGNDQKPFAVVEGYKAADLVLAKASAVAVVPSAPIVTPAPRATPVNAPSPAPSVRMSAPTPTTLTPLITLPAKVNPAALSVLTFTTATVDKNGKVTRFAGTPTQQYAEDLGGGVLLEMVSVKGSGTIKDFWIGKFEVTQAQWRAVMGNDPSNFKGDKLPVENVCWGESDCPKEFSVEEFIERLNAKLGLSGVSVYRLPKETEWEYAARAGTKTEFAFGDTISPEVVNYNGNYPYGKAPKGIYREKTVEVGSLGAANAWGIYEMHGNVWEWCEDIYSSSFRVYRGGSWRHYAVICSARGSYEVPGWRNDGLGFRLVRK